MGPPHRNKFSLSPPCGAALGQRALKIERVLGQMLLNAVGKQFGAAVGLNVVTGPYSIFDSVPFSITESKPVVENDPYIDLINSNPVMFQAGGVKSWISSDEECDSESFSEFLSGCSSQPSRFLCLMMIDTEKVLMSK